ncbi:MAG: MFS transporter [Aestuariivita sp.]|nr:MFS transporter [Aestuariivita sp.]MCY4203583.1 MFS transporter [Aestuariivita sp.]
MSEVEHLELTAETKNLEVLVEWIEEFCAEHWEAAAHEYRIQLVVEELFLNLIHHVEDEEGLDDTVTFQLKRTPQGAELTIVSSGPEFDPFDDAPEPDLDSPVDERTVGGLGIVIVRELTDDQSYKRVSGKNQLILSFGKETSEQSGSENNHEHSSSVGDSEDQTNLSAAAAPSESCRPRSITFQILAVLLVLVTASVASTAVLNYIKFERILTNATAARYDPVLREVDRSIGESLLRGLTLSSTQTTQTFLERSTQQFGQNFSLTVHDLDGATLFHSGEAVLAPDTVPAIGEIMSGSSQPDQYVRHAAITQNGVIVGTITLSHPTTEASWDIEEVSDELETAAIISLVPFLPLLLVLTILMIGRIEGRLHAGMLAVERASEKLTAQNPVEGIWRVQRFLGIVRKGQDWTREMTGSRPILLILLLGLLAFPFLIFGFLSVRVLEPKYLNEFETQTITAVTGVQRRVDYAVSAFGGLSTLRDVERVLDRARSSAPGMSFFALTDPDGDILHLSADFPLEVRSQISMLSAASTAAPVTPFEQTFFDLTGIALNSPVAMAEDGDSDLLITNLPITGENGDTIGLLYAGVDIETLNAVKRDIWIDTGVVIFAVILIATELLILVFSVLLIRPAWAIDFLMARLRHRDLRFTLPAFGGGSAKRVIQRINEAISQAAASARSTLCLILPSSKGPDTVHIPALSHVRLPLFLFFLAEALLRPILPQFLGTFAPTESDSNFWTGIIMAGFMATSLFSVLVGSFLSERTGGPRLVFFVGAVCSGFGMFGHLIANDFYSILGSRMLAGLGYGLVYAAAQVHVAKHTDPIRRTTGFSSFLAVIVAAEVCGPAIGGIVADRFGLFPAFSTAFALIVSSGALCLLLLPRISPSITNPNMRPELSRTEAASNQALQMTGWRSQLEMAREILSNKRFSVAIICFAIPAKALLTGGLFLLVPLIVFASGGGAAESARVLMGYGLAILLLLIFVAPLADRWRGFSLWVAAGSMVAAVGFIVPNGWILLGDGGLLFLFIATVLFGIGQTLSIPTQISFLLESTDRQTMRFGSGPVLGLFRFLERLGSFAGPLIAGVLLLHYSPDIALKWMALGAVLLSALGLSWFLAFGQQDEESQINALLIET